MKVHMSQSTIQYVDNVITTSSFFQQEMADVNCCISMTANHWYVLRCAKEEPDIALGGMWVRTPTASCAFRLNEFYLELCSCTVIGSLDDIMVVSPVTSSHKYPRLEFLVKGMLRYVA